jgi:hypothetical protein
MSDYTTENAAVRAQILAFATKIKTMSAANSAFAEDSGKLEGLTLNEVVELIAGTTGLTIQDVKDSLDAHNARVDNPHAVTAAQVGLGNVDNFASASEAEAAGISYDYTATAGQTAFTGADNDAEVLELEDGAIVYVEKNGQRLGNSEYTFDVPSDTINLTVGASLSDTISVRIVTVGRFMTTDVLWHVIDVFWATKVGAAPATLDTIAEIAAALTDNPDVITNLTTLIGTKAVQADIDAAVAGLTKSSVGLGNVDNFATATSAETIAGTAADKFVTPAGAKAAAEVIATALQASIDTKATPADIAAATGAMTKATIGLGNVEDFGVATNTEALAGTAADKYITPVSMKHVRDADDANVANALSSIEAAFVDAIAILDA